MSTESIYRTCGYKITSKSSPLLSSTVVQNDEVEMLTLTVLRISVIEPECFEQLTTLEWLKLNNNEMRSLPYQLMEPVLTSLKYIDIYSEYSITAIDQTS